MLNKFVWKTDSHRMDAIVMALDMLI
ncbi:hypothetical protein TrRE_jg4247, partial [Triparma retinervis]